MASQHGHSAGCANAPAAFALTAPKRRRRSVSDSPPPSAMAAAPTRSGSPAASSRGGQARRRRRRVGDRDIDLAEIKRLETRLGVVICAGGESAARRLKLGDDGVAGAHGHGCDRFLVVRPDLFADRNEGDRIGTDECGDALVQGADRLGSEAEARESEQRHAQTEMRERRAEERQRQAEMRFSATPAPSPGRHARMTTSISVPIMTKTPKPMASGAKPGRR